MKYTSIHLPATIDDLRITDIDAVEGLLKSQKVTDIIPNLAKLACVSDDELTRIPIGQLKKMVTHIGNLWNGYKTSEPPQRITLRGQRYEFIGKDIGKKQPGGWFIDAETIAKDKPEYMAAMCYIERGMVYAERNERTNAIKNPLEDRAQVMKEELPLSVYLSLSAFFFKKFKKLETGFLWVQAVRLHKAKELMQSQSIGSES